MENGLPEYNDHVGGYSIGKKEDGTTIATKDTTDGGLFVGKSHAEDGGIKTVNIETNEPLLVEGGEVIINKRILASDDEFVCTGTPRDITSKINEQRGGVSWSDKGSCRIVKKAANGIESDVEINRAEEGVGVQYLKSGKIHIITADNEDQAELIEDAINDYSEGFIEKDELENTLQSYGGDSIIEPSDIEVIGGIKHVKSDFYQGWIPLHNQEAVNLDSKAEHGTAIKNGKVSFENIGNGTWAFEYNDNGIKASGIVKKNEKIGEFDYVIEDTHETFDKDNNKEITAGIYREVGSAFSNPENRFMKTHKKAAWGWNILGAMGEKSHEKDNSSEVNSKLVDLNTKWEMLRDEYRYGHFTTEEYFENKKELLAEYEPYIARALQLGIAVNQGILWGVKKAERGTEVNPIQPKPADVRPGTYKIFSLTNSNYPEWTGDIYNIQKYIKESSDFNEEDWEESLYKLGLTYSELPIEAPVMAANGYFRSQDKEKRPSPSVSAKIFPAGYRMEGNDGNIWEISVASNGVHRWVRSHKSVAADGTEVNRVEEVAKYISIGFSVPKDYKPAAWAKAKRYMDQLVELGYVTKNDLGRGKGKYWTNDKSDALSTNLSELSNKLAEILIDSGKIKAEDGIDLFPVDKDGKVTIIEAYDTNEKGDDKEQLWLYLGHPNAQFKVVYTVADAEHIKEDVLSEKGTEFIAEKLEDVVFTDEDGNEAKFGLDEEISAMEDITALFKKYIEGQTWEDKPSSVKIADDEILKAANGVIISSSCGCQHKAANGAKIQDGDIESKINELYTKSKFINDDFNWKNKLLEMLQDKSIESYEIYQSLSEEQKEEVLQELFTLDNDMGSYGDGEISTSKENLDILLADSKNGKKYTKAADGLSVDAKYDWIKSVTHDVTSNGIPFTEEIVSHKGASFILFPISDLQKTSKFIDKAKSEIRNQRDAVSIKVADDNDLDELYKTAYFRDPRTKALKWYQIEQDEKLIRSERKKGTTPTEFVDKFVLPFTKETEKKFRDRSGDKIELLENGGTTGGKSEAEMRAIYVEAYGQEFDSPLRKQSPLPIEMAYKTALNKLLRDKRVELIEMTDPNPVPAGTMGTITGIDGIGQIMVKWDNGSSLSVIPGLDKYKIHGLDKDYFADGGPINRDKVAEVMHEFKVGKLHDSHGKLVTNRKQAIAIALSVARRMAADGKEVGSDWSRIEQNEKEFEAAMKHLGIPKKDWEKYRNDFAANGKRVNEIVITKMSDIENIEDKINEGKVTYRGLGIGKLSDDFYKLAGENGKRIKVDGKEYFVTDSDYRKYEWDEQKNGWKNRIKFDAPYRKFDNGGGIVNENDDMELWFSPGGQHMMPKPKGTALHIFEDYLTQKIGAKHLELTENNDHEYVYQIIGNMDRINQKISELKGFEVETYGVQKRVHIPIEVVNQVVLSIRYPLMTPYADGGPVKDWTGSLGITNEDMKWIDQIEKEHLEEDIIWLFYENFRSPEEAEKAKSKSDIKKYDTKVVEHNGKYWLFFKMNFGLEAFEKVAAADGMFIESDQILIDNGFDINTLTPEQKSLILQPTEAPEVYSQDGEITSGEAMRIWLKKLAQTLKSSDIKKAVRVNFAADGKSININREEFYEWNKPDLKERTKNRLKEITDLGMTEVGVAQFGIKDVMSGLYIEMVWSYTDEEFKSYMDWVKSLIKEKGWVKPEEEAANGAFVKMGDGKSIPLKLLNEISKELYNESSYYTLDKHDHNAGTFVVKEARARMEIDGLFNEAKTRFPNTLKNLGDNYTVSLSAEPNPDFDEDSLEGSINIPEQLVPVKSVSEARNKVMQFISENDLGSGNWSGGQIFENGRPIAFVSYNGRVWEGKIEDGSNKEFKY